MGRRLLADELNESVSVGAPSVAEITPDISENINPPMDADQLGIYSHRWGADERRSHSGKLNESLSVGAPSVAKITPDFSENVDPPMDADGRGSGRKFVATDGAQMNVRSHSDEMNESVSVGAPSVAKMSSAI